ncbi:hypothetical protein ACIRJO_03530 [Streptomyces sp. NPDC102394]|uniref:hypothetical protein n=1 Tax=Streptomyces sp. NPDC102394 TaxID=3366167 RepID=UPI003816A451
MKHYNDDKDPQGEFRGMQLIGGVFCRPLMPITRLDTYRNDEIPASNITRPVIREPFGTIS